MQHHCVFHAQRGRRNLRDGRVIAHRARVRTLYGERGHAPYECRHRAGSGCRGRCTAAVTNRLPIVGEWHVEEYDPPLRLGRPRFEVGEAGDDKHRRRDSAARCSNAPSKPDHVQLLRTRPDEHHRFLPSHPVRNHHRFSAHILEAIALHLGENPVECRLERLRSAQPVSERIGETGGTVPCGAVGERRVYQPVRHRAVPVRNWRGTGLRRLLCGERDCGDSGQQRAAKDDGERT